MQEVGDTKLASAADKETQSGRHTSGDAVLKLPPDAPLVSLNLPNFRVHIEVVGYSVHMLETVQLL